MSAGSYGQRGYEQGRSSGEYGSQGSYGSYGGQGYGAQGWGQGNYGGNRGGYEREHGGQVGPSGQYGQYGQSGYGQYGRGQVGGPYGREYGSQYGQSAGGGWEPMPGWSGRGERGREDDDRGMLERAGDWIKEKISGKPPKGYRRSDERIREDVCDLIMRRSNVDASDVEVAVADGEVTLTGSVRDKMSKRRLEDLAEEVLGVEDVHNRVTVRREMMTTSTSTSQTGTTGTTTQTGTTGTTTGTTPRHRA